jgi:hypothetical protein
VELAGHSFVMTSVTNASLRNAWNHGVPNRYAICPIRYASFDGKLPHRVISVPNRYAIVFDKGLFCLSSVSHPGPGSFTLGNFR